MSDLSDLFVCSSPMVWLTTDDGLLLTGTCGNSVFFCCLEGSGSLADWPSVKVATGHLVFRLPILHLSHVVPRSSCPGPDDTPELPDLKYPDGTLVDMVKLFKSIRRNVSHKFLLENQPRSAKLMFRHPLRSYIWQLDGPELSVIARSVLTPPSPRTDSAASKTLHKLTTDHLRKVTGMDNFKERFHQCWQQVFQQSPFLLELYNAEGAGKITQGDLRAGLNRANERATKMREEAVSTEAETGQGESKGGGVDSEPVRIRIPVPDHIALERDMPKPAEDVLADEDVDEDPFDDDYQPGGSKRTRTRR